MLMKRTKLYASLVMMSLLLSAGLTATAQDDESVLDIGADIMSRYVWRGTDFGGSPSIQPYIELGLGSLSIGAWGAYTTNKSAGQEMDLYATYSIMDMFSVTVTDYFFPDEFSGYNYFEFNADSGSLHIIEGAVSFDGTDNLPLSVMAAYNLVNDESFYLELGYSFPFMDVFLGAGNGFYTVEDPGDDDKFGIVNLGISTSREIPITEKFSLPLSASLICNPNAKGIHLVFGISF